MTKSRSLLLAVAVVLIACHPNSQLFADAAETTAQSTDAACLQKIIRLYKGPALEKANFPDGFRVQFTVEPNGSVKWIHPQKDENHLSPTEQKATAALREALIAASPLPVAPSGASKQWQAQIAIHDQVHYWNLDFPGYITCMAGNEAEKRWPRPFQSVPQSIQKQVVDRFSFTTSSIGLTAAVWCFITPDGTIDSITPIRALRTKSKVKSSFAEIGRAQKAITKALQASSPLTLPAAGKYPKPRGLVVLYENDRHPQLQFEDYFYERCPDRVLDARP